MIPGKYNMVCPQGSTFAQDLTYSVDDVPVNLSGWTAEMQIRDKHTSTTAKATLTIGNGGVQILGGGVIRLYLANTATALMAAKEYVYDIELTSPLGVVSRILEGKFIVTPEVTR